MSLSHRRNQTRHVFYDLVNEQRCCENVRLGAWRWEGGGPVSDRDSSVCTPSSTPTPHPLCLHGGALPREQCWTDRNLCPHFQKFSLILYTRAWKRRHLSTCTSLQPVWMKLFVHPLFNRCVSAVNLCPSDFHQQWVAGLRQWEGLPYVQPSYRWADLWGPGGR